MEYDPIGSLNINAFEAYGRHGRLSG